MPWQVAAQTGHNVTLVDVKDEFLDKSRANIEGSIKRVAKKMFKVRAGESCRKQAAMIFL